jgi:hypothetical protein
MNLSNAFTLDQPKYVDVVTNNFFTQIAHAFFKKKELVERVNILIQLQTLTKRKFIFYSSVHFCQNLKPTFFQDRKFFLSFHMGTSKVKTKSRCCFFG